MEPPTPRQLRTIRDLLAKANPPPFLYRYRRPNEWALKEISSHEVHVACPTDMNDPFEYRAPTSIDLKKLKNLMLQRCLEAGMNRSDAEREADCLDTESAEMLRQGIEAIPSSSGIICCSATPRSNRMWAYYAECHRGICIGYRTDLHPFNLAMSVIYENPTEPLDVVDAVNRDLTEFCDHLARRKGKEWDFEQEYRIGVGQIPDNHTRILPISPACIQEVRLGVKIDPDFKLDVLQAIRKLPSPPKIIQMGCDFDSFILTESEIKI